MKLEKAAKKLKKFYSHNKRLPTYAEMTTLFGFASTNASYALVKKLIAAGMLEKGDNGKLLPNKLFAIPHLGVIKAGTPIPAESIAEDSVDFYAFLLNLPEDIFCLTVRGNSMIDAGINDGDLAIVERGRPPKEGDIVAATIDGECTLKLLKKKTWKNLLAKGKYFLAAANPAYPDIYPLESLHVDGVVIHVIRKYH